MKLTDFILYTRNKKTIFTTVFIITIETYQFGIYPKNYSIIRMEQCRACLCTQARIEMKPLRDKDDSAVPILQLYSIITSIEVGA